MTEGQSGMPTAIDGDGPDLRITWDDGHVSRHNFQRLRFHCACAGCVDENTGKKKIVLEFIDPNVRPMKVEQSGRWTR